MYGTIARFKVKKDKLQDFLALGSDWDERERVRATGFVSAELLWEDKEEARAALIVHFASKDAYVRNAQSPEQDRFYRRMRECLENDPEWIDGTFQPWSDRSAAPHRTESETASRS